MKHLSRTTQLLELDLDENGVPNSLDFESAEGAPEFILKQLFDRSAEGVTTEEKQMIASIRQQVAKLYQNNTSEAATLYSKLLLHLSNFMAKLPEKKMF